MSYNTICVWFWEATDLIYLVSGENYNRMRHIFYLIFSTRCGNAWQDYAFAVNDLPGSICTFDCYMCSLKEQSDFPYITGEFLMSFLECCYTCFFFDSWHRSLLKMLDSWCPYKSKLLLTTMSGATLLGNMWTWTLRHVHEVVQAAHCIGCQIKSLRALTKVPSSQSFQASSVWNNDRVIAPKFLFFYRIYSGDLVPGKTS